MKIDFLINVRPIAGGISISGYLFNHPQDISVIDAEKFLGEYQKNISRKILDFVSIFTREKNLIGPIPNADTAKAGLVKVFIPLEVIMQSIISFQIVQIDCFQED